MPATGGPLDLGALLMPLGIVNRRHAAAAHDPHADRVSFGILPVARRDLERLHQMMQLIPRMLDPDLPPRVARSLPHRPAFPDALTWLEIFSDAPEAVDHWKQVLAHRPPTVEGEHDAAAGDGAVAAMPAQRRRRRRRR